MMTGQELIWAVAVTLAALWYLLTTLAVWRFCDALDGQYFWTRLGVTLFWPVVLPACGFIFLLGAAEHTFSRRYK